MKVTKLFLTAGLFGVLALSSCNSGVINKGDRMPNTSSSKIDSVSYALGVWFGETVKHTDMGEINLAQVDKGRMDVFNEDSLKISDKEVMSLIQSYMQERQQFAASKNVEEAKTFFEENAKKDGVVTTESGLQYKIIKEGSDVKAGPTDTVTVDYEGKLLDGTVFDSSYTRGTPATFPLNGVIKGWGEGLTYVGEGGQIELYIPASLGYGDKAYGPIPANSALTFKVEVKKVSPAKTK